MRRGEIRIAGSAAELRARLPEIEEAYMSVAGSG
jgi:hypothetical protein